jgi:hypothetical protein
MDAFILAVWLIALLSLSNLSATNRSSFLCSARFLSWSCRNFGETPIRSLITESCPDM